MRAHVHANTFGDGEHGQHLMNVFTHAHANRTACVAHTETCKQALRSCTHRDRCKQARAQTRANGAHPVCTHTNCTLCTHIHREAHITPCTSQTQATQTKNHGHGTGRHHKHMQGNMCTDTRSRTDAHAHKEADTHPHTHTRLHTETARTQRGPHCCWGR